MAYKLDVFLIYIFDLILGLSKVACYKWVKTGKVPAQRVKSLMLLKPEWFEDKVEDDLKIPV